MNWRIVDVDIILKMIVDCQFLHFNKIVTKKCGKDGFEIFKTNKLIGVKRWPLVQIRQRGLAGARRSQSYAWLLNEIGALDSSFECPGRQDHQDR